MTGLTPLAKYYYRVSAENAAGISDPAEAIGPLTADDPHGKQISFISDMSAVQSKRYISLLLKINPRVLATKASR